MHIPELSCDSVIDSPVRSADIPSRDFSVVVVVGVGAVEQGRVVPGQEGTVIWGENNAMTTCRQINMTHDWLELAPFVLF